MRQKFVEGEPGDEFFLRRKVLRRLGVVQAVEAGAETLPIRRAQKFFVEPFGQLRQAGERRRRRLGHHARKKAFGQAIDRLDRGQGGKAGLVENAIGMDHLAEGVVKLDQAGHPAGFADRQGLFDPAGIGAEEDQGQVAGLVFGQHAPRAFSARRAMLDDPHFESRDGADRRLGDFGPVAAVDAGKGKMQQQINSARGAVGVAEQPIEQLAGLGADAGQSAGAGEKGIEKRRPHQESIASRR